MQPFIEERDDLPAEIQTFVRMMAGIQEEAEAIGIYEQRAQVEADGDANAVILEAQKEEMKHFAMQLAVALRLNETFSTICKGILFKDGDLVKLGVAAEKAAE